MKVLVKSLSVLLVSSALLITNAFSQVSVLDSVNQSIDSLCNIGKCREAIMQLNALMECNDEYWFSLSKKLIAINESVEDFESNLHIFKEAHKRGYFYFIHKQIPRFAPYLNLPGFDSISTNDLLLREKANDLSTTIFEVQLPNNCNLSNRYPLIFILHGGGKSLAEVKNHWNSNSLSSGFIKVYLQSYRHFDSNSFGWGSLDERLDNDIRRIYQEIIGEYNVDTSMILFGGISAGATAAIDLSLRKVIPAKGFIAYCPDIPSFLNKSPELLTNNNIRGYINSGEKDRFINKQYRLTSLFDSLGVDYKFVVEPSRGHEYPRNENFAIIEGLRFILNIDLVGSSLEEKILNAISKKNCRGLSIAIVENSIPLYYNYGRIDDISEETPDQNTIFEIGSISKIFTIFIYYSLVQKQILDPNAKVSKYLPEISNIQVANIKIAQLVNHKSGIPSMPDNVRKNEFDTGVSSYNDSLFIQFLNSLKSLNTDNEFIYSNSGIALLGLVLERSTNKSYSELLNKYVIQEFDLQSTFIDVPDSKKELFAKGSKVGINVEYWDMNNVLAPTGGIRSTAEDLSKFLCKFLCSDEYSSIRDSMLKNPITVNEETLYFSGWFASKMNGSDHFWVAGSTGGFSSFMAYSKSSNRCVIILSNSNVRLNELGLQLLDI